MKMLISGDYNAFNEGWNGCGAYMASGLYQSDTFKLPIYVGSSVDLKTRINRHIRNLDNNQHDNLAFEYAWQKHQKEFVWFCLESTTQENLLQLEQKYLDIYQPFVDCHGGFNVNRKADKPPDPTGKPVSAATRQKISQANKGKPLSIEHRKKLSLAKLGKPGNRLGYKMTDEQKKKNSLAHLGKKHSLETRKKMSQAHLGKKNPGSRERIIAINKARKGYRHSEETKKKMSQAHLGNERGVKRFYDFINPQGQLIKIWNVKKFCDQHSELRHANMYALHTGKLKSYKGWRKGE
jgi:group I intron endonuclease